MQRVAWRLGRQSAGLAPRRSLRRDFGTRKKAKLQLTAEEWDKLSPRTEEEKLVDKIVEEEYKKDLSNLDLRGANVVTKVITFPGGDTLYDFGHATTLRTPKPLHLRGDPNSTSSSSVERLRMAAKDTGDRSSDPVMSEIVLPVDTSDLMLVEGELLPNFDKEPVSASAVADDPYDLAWRMLNYAMDTRKPVRGRILNQINGGFSVAIGAVVCFMPNSHLSPFIKGNTSRTFEKLVNAIMGHQLWVMVLKCDERPRNVVVSHRTVPRSHLLPQIQHTERQGMSRPRVRRAPVIDVPAASAPATPQADGSGEPVSA